MDCAVASPASKSDTRQPARGRLYLEFRLGTDRYALDVRQIVEVQPVARFKQVPEAPAWVAGLHLYRGELLPVLDLSSIACGRPSAQHTSTRLVLVEYRRSADAAPQRLGLILEHASHTVRRDPQAFRDYGLERGEARYLGPVLEDEDGLLQQVEIDELLPEGVRAMLIDAAREAQA
ncbi:MAG: hypothetical protein GAK43_00532 [Stenotrophomonas maltophilia]|nr:MAG: hypothetical protein GAK43_00532 [Stenotrophomonas maltophilia]